MITNRTYRRFVASAARRISRLLIFYVAVGALLLAWQPKAHSQDAAQQKTSAPPAAAPPAAAPSVSPKKVRFAFSRTPWPDVLQWLARTAGLSLHVGALPTGSFTYADEQNYTPDEAISRINMFLIPQRFSLVRSGTVLTVISFDDETSMRQIDSMAELVRVEDLAKRNSHDLVKCLFPLGHVPAEQAIQDLGGLLLIREPTLLRNTNQLLLTDTVSKLQAAHRILESLAQSHSVKRFDLGNLEAEQVLTQIRPHVGLEPLAMTGTGISFSLGLNGRELLVSGSKDKVNTVEGVISMIQSRAEQATKQAQLEFRPHPIGSADMQTVMSVLQTLLADQNVRLAPDVASRQIAVLATEASHALIDKTIHQLSTTDALEFKSIPLRSVDPRFAIALLTGVFEAGGPEKTSSASARPHIDADPLNGRLLVRGKASQIAEIERILAQLNGPARDNSSLLRVLPYRGERGQNILQMGERLWPYSEPVLILPSQENVLGPSTLERAIDKVPKQDTKESNRQSLISPEQGNVSHIQKSLQSDRRAVQAQLTADGILIQSSDPDALNRFEEHLRTIAGHRNSSDLRMAAFYLKHTSASDADQLLRRLLDAEAASSPAGPVVDAGSQHGQGQSGRPTSPGLVNAWTFRTATIIADSRLNRVFIYGSPSEIGEIEGHLQVIDREKSITDVKVHGAPRIVHLKHAEARQVAEIIRDAYAGRIAATANERKEAVQQALRQPQGPGARGEGGVSQLVSTIARGDSSDSPRMTVATDIPNNSLIITAPAQLADEVERLALDLDRQAETIGEESAEIIRVVSVKNAPYVNTALKQLFGDSVKDGRTEDKPTTDSPSRTRPLGTLNHPTNVKAGAPKSRP